MVFIESRKEWHITEYDRDQVAFLSDELKINALLAKILIAHQTYTKSVSIPEIKQFLAPQKKGVSAHDYISTPEELKASFDCLKQCLKSNQKVVVNGDSDADGITAATVVVAALRYFGIETRYDFPIRSKEGHGLQIRIIDEAKKNGASVIITTDCGTKDVEAVAYANSLGIKVIVCDHHILGAKRPDALAMINPQCCKGTEKGKKLSGSGVALKWMYGLAHHLNRSFETEFNDYLIAIASLGTISDRVSLKEQVNRAIVVYGIRALNEAKLPGLKALKNICVGNSGFLKARDISRTIAPRLNAPGRIGNKEEGIPDSNVVVDLLLNGLEAYEHGSKSGMKKYMKNFLKVFDLDPKAPIKEVSAKEAELVEEVNDQRRRITEKIDEEIELILEKNVNLETDKVIIIRGKNWNSGVIGIDTDRLRDRFSRPAIILTEMGGDDYLKGSVRSLQTIDMYTVIDKVQVTFEEKHKRPLFVMKVMSDDGEKLINAFGGHAQACGFSIHKDDVDEFSQLVKDEVNQLPADQFNEYYSIIEELSFDKVNKELLKRLDSLSPYGEHFNYPLFVLKKVMINPNLRPFGNKFQRHRTPHVEFDIYPAGDAVYTQKTKRLVAVGFGLFEKLVNLIDKKETQFFDLVFSIALSGKKGGRQHKRGLNLLVEDIRLHE